MPKRFWTTRLWSCLLAMAALPLVVSPGQAQQPSQALRAKSPDAEMIATLAAQGRVRVIVHYRLMPEGSPQAAPDDAAIRDNRKVQEAIITDYFGPPAALSGPDRALRQLPVTPAFAINASGAEIEALALDSRVLDITLDQPRRPAPGTAQ